MDEDPKQSSESTMAGLEAEGELEEREPESNNNLREPLLLKRNRTLSSNPLAIIGTKVSHIESLDYE